MKTKQSFVKAKSFTKPCWNVQQFTQFLSVKLRKGEEVACLWSRLFGKSANKTDCRMVALLSHEEMSVQAGHYREPASLPTIVQEKKKHCLLGHIFSYLVDMKIITFLQQTYVE